VVQTTSQLRAAWLSGVLVGIGVHTERMEDRTLTGDPRPHVLWPGLSVSNNPRSRILKQKRWTAIHKRGEALEDVWTQ